MAATTTPAATAKKKPDEVERPSTYRVGLDNGWQLYITPESPGGGFFRRPLELRDALGLGGGEEIAAAVEPEDVAALAGQLFGSGVEVDADGVGDRAELLPSALEVEPGFEEPGSLGALSGRDDDDH